MPELEEIKRALEITEMTYAGPLVNPNIDIIDGIPTGVVSPHRTINAALLWIIERLEEPVGTSNPSPDVVT